MSDLRKFIATTIREFLNENDESKFYNIFIGYHCSDNPNLETERSSLNLGEDDYWEWHEEALKQMKEKYPLSQKYLNKIGHFDVNKRKYVGEEIGFDTKLTNDINNFLNKLKIKGIFVNDNKPNSRWGKYCYEVYFDKIEFDPIQDFKMLDEGDENSFLYIYQKETPKFRKINSSLDEDTQNKYTDK